MRKVGRNGHVLMEARGERKYGTRVVPSKKVYKRHQKHKGNYKEI
jgi:hypothetical protein